MPRRDIEQLSDASRVWVFPVSPSLGSDGEKTLLATVDSFLSEWAAHGTPVTSSRQLLEGTFLVIAAEKNAETSGCSIDRLFGTMKTLESRLGVSILDANRLFYRDAGGAIRSTTRTGFRDLVASETINASTSVFDPLVETLGDVRHGSLEKPAGESWHMRQPVVAG